MYYYAGSVCDFYLALLVANDCFSEVFYPLKILLYPLFFCCLWTVKPAVEIQYVTCYSIKQLKLSESWTKSILDTQDEGPMKDLLSVYPKYFCETAHLI